MPTRQSDCCDRKRSLFSCGYSGMQTGLSPPRRTVSPDGTALPNFLEREFLAHPPDNDRGAVAQSSGQEVSVGCHPGGDPRQQPTTTVRTPTADILHDCRVNNMTIVRFHPTFLLAWHRRIGDRSEKKPRSFRIASSGITRDYHCLVRMSEIVRPWLLFKGSNANGGPPTDAGLYSKAGCLSRIFWITSWMPIFFKYGFAGASSVL